MSQCYQCQQCWWCWQGRLALARVLMGPLVASTAVWGQLASTQPAQQIQDKVGVGAAVAGQSAAEPEQCSGDDVVPGAVLTWAGGETV